MPTELGTERFRWQITCIACMGCAVPYFSSIQGLDPIASYRALDVEATVGLILVSAFCSVGLAAPSAQPGRLTDFLTGDRNLVCLLAALYRTQQHRIPIGKQRTKEEINDRTLHYS